jgi:threonine aldolase
MAKRLAAGIANLPGVKIAYAVDSNAVFAELPQPAVAALHDRGWQFYTNVGGWEEARLMCSWDTTTGDVDQFVAELRAIVTPPAPPHGY